MGHAAHIDDSQNLSGESGEMARWLDGEMARWLDDEMADVLAEQHVMSLAAAGKRICHKATKRPKN